MQNEISFIVLLDNGDFKKTILSIEKQLNSNILADLIVLFTDTNKELCEYLSSISIFRNVVSIKLDSTKISVSEVCSKINTNYFIFLNSNQVLYSGFINCFVDKWCKYDFDFCCFNYKEVDCNFNGYTISNISFLDEFITGKQYLLNMFRSNSLIFPLLFGKIFTKKTFLNAINTEIDFAAPFIPVELFKISDIKIKTFSDFIIYKYTDDLTKRESNTIDYYSKIYFCVIKYWPKYYVKQCLNKILKCIKDYNISQNENDISLIINKNYFDKHSILYLKHKLNHRDKENILTLKFKITVSKINRFSKSIKKLFSIIKDTKKSKNNIFLLDTPSHPNLGDQAILLSEINLLKSVYNNKKIYIINHSQIKYLRVLLKMCIFKNDILFIHGGGFIGSLWPEEHNIFLFIINLFKNNKIIIFPQTVYFYEDDIDLRNRFYQLIRKVKNNTFMVRDYNSFKILTNRIPKESLRYTPDIVLTNTLFPEKDLPVSRDKRVLLLFRKDLEKVSDNSKVEILLNKLHINFDYSDTVLQDELFTEEKSHNYVAAKLKEMSKYSLVITDRLHGMIFSTITSTPCIAFDNVSHKVSQTYEFIKNLDHIICISENELNDDLILKMISKKATYYDGGEVLKMIRKEILNEDNNI